MAKMGRPKIEINKVFLEDLLTIDPTAQEVADVLRVDADTLNSFCKREYNMTFSALLKQKKSDYKVSLRRKAFRMADKSAAVLIFMLKNKLGWTDSPAVENNIEGAKIIIQNPVIDEKFKEGIDKFIKRQEELEKK